MSLLQSKASKIALLASVSALVISTPLLASNGLGLRGTQYMQASAHGQSYGQGYGQSYGMQNAASGYYNSPQAQRPAQPRYQYLGQVTRTYQVPANAPMPRQQPYYQPNTMSSSYVQANSHQYGYPQPQQLPMQYSQQAQQGVPVGNYQYQRVSHTNYGPLRGPSQTYNSHAHNNSFNLGGMNIRTNLASSRTMLDWQENTTGKALSLLTNRANGTLAPNSLYIGGGFKAALMWQKTSDAGLFPLLSRFPDFSNRTDDQTGVFAINNAALSFTGTFGEWATMYLQQEYSETEFFSQGEMQLRKAFVVFGNLQKTPFYAAFGRKTIDFGNFDGYNAFTQTEGQHYFHAVSDQPVLELGYYKNGFKLSASAFSAGRQLRTAYAGEENNLGNYAAKIEKEFRFKNNSSFTIGTSYLHDTIYRNNFTAHTFNAIFTGTPPANFLQYRNSAIDAFVEYNSPLLDVMFEYTTTLKPWGAAIPQDSDGNIAPAYLIDPLGSQNDINNISFDQNLEVFVAQIRYKPIINGRPVAFSAVGNWGNIGDNFTGVGMMGQPTTWTKNQQHMFSVEYPLNPYMDFGMEYVYNKGFIPFVAPQLISSNDTVAHAINIGIKARF